MNQLPRCQLEVGITPTEPTETIGTGGRKLMKLHKQNSKYEER
jgi:hypothetical protein